jgi:hypothetical protein
MRNYNVFTIENGVVTRGAVIEKLLLSDGKTYIPAILVGKKTKGSDCGAISAAIPPHEYQRYQNGEEVRVYAGNIGKNHLGNPKFFTKPKADDDEYVIVVIKTTPPLGGESKYAGTTHDDELGTFPGKVIVRGRISLGEQGELGTGTQCIALVKKDIRFRTSYTGVAETEPISHMYFWDGKRLFSTPEYKTEDEMS